MIHEPRRVREPSLQQPFPPDPCTKRLCLSTLLADSLCGESVGQRQRKAVPSLSLPKPLQNILHMIPGKRDPRQISHGPTQEYHRKQRIRA